MGAFITDFKILFEDKHILVVVKPPGIPVQQDIRGRTDLLNMLKSDIKSRFDKPGNVYLGLVHRLDQPVGGVMVFAKRSKAASRLQRQMSTRKIAKRYLAVVEGVPPQSGSLCHWLYKDKESNTVFVSAPERKGAREARLAYRRLAASGKRSLLEITLETGRPHQIRVQLSAENWPICGDRKYNPAPREKSPALWAAGLGLLHPMTGEQLFFEQKPPQTGIWNTFADSLSEWHFK